MTDRKNFTAGQALFPDRAAENPVAIYPPGFSIEDGDDGALSIGAIAGIAVAAVAVVLIAIGVVWWLSRRRRRERKAATASLAYNSSVDSNEAAAREQMDRKSLSKHDSAEQTDELLSSNHRFPERAELLVSEEYRRTELEDHASEVYASPVYGRYELGTGDVNAYEMDTRSANNNSPSVARPDRSRP